MRQQFISVPQSRTSAWVGHHQQVQVNARCTEDFPSLAKRDLPTKVPETSSQWIATLQLDIVTHLHFLGSFLAISLWADVP